MPNDLNKQSLINLLIDSPLREPIKINLIDIVNNTSDVDLPKIFPTIVKELEIFQKATERRMKLAEETIAKLSSDSSAPAPEQASPVPDTTPVMPTASEPAMQPVEAPAPVTAPTPLSEPTPAPQLSVPPLDLPPLPQIPTPTTDQPVQPTPTEATPTSTTPSSNSLPTPEPLGTPSAPAAATDEAALAEIQKELESLKAGVTADAAAPITTTPPVQA